MSHSKGKLTSTRGFGSVHVQEDPVREEGLCAAGMTPLPNGGGYFLIAKLPNNHPLVPADSDDNHNIHDEPYDWRYCRMLAHEYGVIGIPASSFFSQRYHETMEGGVSTSWYARFALCKKDKTILEAAKRLRDNAYKGQ